MKPRFVVRQDSYHKWHVVDKDAGSISEVHPTRKEARERASKLNALDAEWKSDTQQKAAE